MKLAAVFLAALIVVLGFDLGAWHDHSYFTAVALLVVGVVFAAAVVGLVLASVLNDRNSNR